MKKKIFSFLLLVLCFFVVKNVYASEVTGISGVSFTLDKIVEKGDAYNLNGVIWCNYDNHDSAGRCYEINGTHSIDFDVSRIEWSSSNPSVATVDSDGNFTAVSAGVADISMTIRDDPDKKYVVTVKVYDELKYKDICLNSCIGGSNLVIIDLGDTYTFGLASYNNYTIMQANSGIELSDFTWTSSNPSVATVDSNGVITGISTGSSEITAVSKEYPEVSAKGTVTVAIKVNFDLNGGTAGSCKIAVAGASRPDMVVENGLVTVWGSKNMLFSDVATERCYFSKEGYVLDGWSLSNTEIIRPETDVFGGLTTGTTLYAVWRNDNFVEIGSSNLTKFTCNVGENFTLLLKNHGFSPVGYNTDNTNIASVADNDGLQVNCTNCRLVKVSCLSPGETYLVASGYAEHLPTEGAQAYEARKKIIVLGNGTVPSTSTPEEIIINPQTGVIASFVSVTVAIITLVMAIILFNKRFV